MTNDELIRSLQSLFHSSIVIRHSGASYTMRPFRTTSRTAPKAYTSGYTERRVRSTRVCSTAFRLLYSAQAKAWTPCLHSRLELDGDVRACYVLLAENSCLPGKNSRVRALVGLRFDCGAAAPWLIVGLDPLWTGA